MADNAGYSASLTGEPFLFYEIRQIARLKLNGLSNQEIETEVKSNNLFQYATEKSIPKRLKASMKRIQALDETMLHYLIEKPLQTGMIINLYAIMKTNRLVFDFIVEVIGEKFESNHPILEKCDINEYFLLKQEQHDEIALWKDDTIKKLKQVMIRIILEAGILDERDKRSLHRPNIDTEVSQYLKEMAGPEVIKAMGITM